MRGFTFIRQTKLHNVCGRINYISSYEEQEYLYATYETNPEPFWEDLARECQIEFKKSGSPGRCTEARELIIALPQSLAFYNPNELLELFTEEFKEKYGVECSSALHHNSRKTNYHIHLIYSERKLLDEPEKKIATRNVFLNAEGKKVRTKKEILDVQGNILPGCKIVRKGDIYDQHMFGKKNDYFKTREFIKEVKKHYTTLMNELSRPREKLEVFNPNGPYLPTKKIGKNNKYEKEIREDNEIRDEWNRQVNLNIIYGIPADSMKEMKESEIIEPIRESAKNSNSNVSDFRQIVLRAIETARNCARRFRLADKQERESILDSFKSFISEWRSPERERKIYSRDDFER